MFSLPFGEIKAEWKKKYIKTVIVRRQTNQYRKLWGEAKTFSKAGETTSTMEAHWWILSKWKHWCWTRQTKRRKRTQEKAGGQRATCTNRQESHPNFKLEAIVYTQMTWCGLMYTLHVLPQPMWVCMFFGHINLESFVFLVSFIPSGPYALFAFSSPWLPEPCGG